MKFKGGSGGQEKKRKKRAKMQLGVLGWGRHAVGREGRGGGPAGRWSFSFESYLPPLSYIYKKPQEERL